ncbi:MAG: hypothetical protein RL662_30 [Bacteroidota bacterium]|jgi:serine O-acetyltransferase
MSNIYNIAEQLNSKSKSLPINKKELESIVDVIFHNILFPICDKGCSTTIKPLYNVYSILLDSISSLTNKIEAEQIVETFISKLPSLQEQLLNEAKYYLQNDPAARSIEEIILTYPGFYALSVHRLSHILFNLGTPIIPRLFSEYAHSAVGIDIHPGANIGDLFYIDHGTGIVIGETAIIGKNVKMYQGVTLGALFVTKELQYKKRHPTIEDNVVIYAGATILGGATIIGHDSTIGGNVWLTKSVTPYSLVFHNSEVRIRTTHDLDNSFNYTI